MPIDPSGLVAYALTQDVAQGLQPSPTPLATQIVLGRVTVGRRTIPVGIRTERKDSYKTAWL